MTVIFGYKRKTIKNFPSKAILIIGLFLIFNEKKNPFNNKGFLQKCIFPLLY